MFLLGWSMIHCNDKKEQHYFGKAVHSPTISGLCCQLLEVCHCSFISYFEWAFKIGKKNTTHYCSIQRAFFMTPSVTFLNGKDALLRTLATPSIFLTCEVSLLPRRDGLKGGRKWRLKLRKAWVTLYKWKGLLAAVRYLSVYMWKTSCRHETLGEEEYSKGGLLGFFLFLYFVILKIRSSNRYTKIIYFKKLYVLDHHPNWATVRNACGLAVVGVGVCPSTTTCAPDVAPSSCWAGKEQSSTLPPPAPGWLEQTWKTLSGIQIRGKGPSGWVSARFPPCSYPAWKVIRARGCVCFPAPMTLWVQ